MPEIKKNYATAEKLKELDFLFQNEEFTVPQVRQVLRVIFRTKTSRSLGQFTPYHIKHLMEWIADFVREQPFRLEKYCQVATMREALAMEGFTNFGDPFSSHYNISAREYLEIYNLINQPRKVYSLINPVQARPHNARKNLAK